jgi:hypothetical protein
MQGNDVAALHTCEFVRFHNSMDTYFAVGFIDAANFEKSQALDVLREMSKEQCANIRPQLRYCPLLLSEQLSCFLEISRNIAILVSNPVIDANTHCIHCLVVSRSI